jgi:site-specific recombinase XerD
VFPGDAKGKPVQDIKRFWNDVRAKAAIPDARVHDLRHTFASLLVSGGMSLPMIGKLLGHTQVQTTQRYAHIFDDRLRAGVNEDRRYAAAEAAHRRRRRTRARSFLNKRGDHLTALRQPSAMLSP